MVDLLAVASGHFYRVTECYVAMRARQHPMLPKRVVGYPRLFTGHRHAIARMRSNARASPCSPAVIFQLVTACRISLVVRADAVLLHLSALLDGTRNIALTSRTSERRLPPSALRSSGRTLKLTLTWQVARLGEGC
jgi:hypothetical protein